MSYNSMKTMYISNVSDINKLQTDIMVFIGVWVRTEKTAVPQREILEAMRTNGIPESTTLNALNMLLRKNYIRKGINYSSTLLQYVQLRTVAAV